MQCSSVLFMKIAANIAKLYDCKVYYQLSVNRFKFVFIKYEK